MAEIYIKAASGADSGETGTISSPFKNYNVGGLAQTAIAALANNSTIYLAGEFFATTALEIANKTNVQIKQWPGQDPAIIRRDVVVVPSSTTLGVTYGAWTAASDVASITLSGTLPTIVGVTWCYERSIDQDGRHRPFLRNISGVATGWSYDFGVAGAGVLRINIPGLGSKLPSASDVGAIVTFFTQGTAAPAGVGLTSCTDCVVDGLTVQLVDPFNNAYPAFGPGYGIGATASLRNIIQNCVVKDCGWHGIGFTGAYTTDNIVRNCEMWGGCPGSTNMVYYAGPNPTNYVTGNKMYGCATHTYSHLRPNGSSLYTTDSYIDPFISHTSGQPAYIDNLEIYDCFFKCYPQAAVAGALGGGAYYGGNINIEPVVGGAKNTGLTGTPPTDIYDWTQYPVILRDCTLIACGGNFSNAAIVRCVFQGVTVGAGGGFSFPRSNGWYNGNARRNILIDSCDISHYYLAGNGFNTDGALIRAQNTISNLNIGTGLTYTWTGSAGRFTNPGGANGRFLQQFVVGDTVAVTGVSAPGTYTITNVASDLTYFDIATNVNPAGTVTGTVGLGICQSIYHNWSYLLVNSNFTMVCDFNSANNNPGGTIFAITGNSGNINSKIGIKADRCTFAYSSPATSNFSLMNTINCDSALWWYGTAEWNNRFQFTNCIFHNMNSTVFSAAPVALSGGVNLITQSTWMANASISNCIVKNPGFWNFNGQSAEVQDTRYIGYTPATTGRQSKTGIRGEVNGQRIGAYQRPGLTGLKGLRNGTQPMFRSPSIPNLSPAATKVIQIDLGP